MTTDPNHSETGIPLREAMVDLARRVGAASSPREVAFAAAAAAERLFGWDVWWAEIWNRHKASAGRLIGFERTPSGVSELAGWRADLAPGSVGANRYAGGPLLVRPDGPGRELLQTPSGLPAPSFSSAMCAPLGTSSATPGLFCVLSRSANTYTNTDLELFRALATFLGDAWERAVLLAEPIRPPAELTEENRLLRNLFDALPDYLYVKTVEGKFLMGNKALLRSFGLSEEREVIGMDDSSFASPELLAQYRADEIAVIASGQPIIGREELVVEASGERVRVSTTKVALRDEEGRVIGIAGVGHAPRREATPSPSNFRRGTVKDAAREAGVSTATVLRAFSGSSLVTEETRQRVFDAAREVGYHPNVAARSLSKGRAETVALVLRPSQLRGEFYSGLLAGFQTIMRGRDLEMLLSVVPHNEDPLAWVHKLVLGRTCGAIAVHHEILHEATPKALESLPIPAVLVNYSTDITAPPPPHITTIGFNNRGGTRLAVRHLVALGHCRIGYMGGTPGHPDAIQRERGFRGTMEELGLDIVEEWVAESTFELDTEGAIAGVSRILSARNERPTAIACASDAIAAGALLGAHKWGQSVPRDLSVTGFDDLSWAGLCTPPLTTVSHKGYDLGVAAGQALIARMDDHKLGPEAILLEPRLVVRDSTAPPPRGC
jgi:LacI family transcriptional regulator, repressor for deo operon, udp, cdd, tsx, nupC, and nupG